MILPFNGAANTTVKLSSKPRNTSPTAHLYVEYTFSANKSYVKPNDKLRFW